MQIDTFMGKQKRHIIVIITSKKHSKNLCHFENIQR